MPTTAQRELYDRLTDLLGAHDVHPDDRIRIQDAYHETMVWTDLRPEIQQLVEELERTLPRQSWDDPADVPDNLDDLD